MPSSLVSLLSVARCALSWKLQNNVCTSSPSRWKHYYKKLMYLRHVSRQGEFLLFFFTICNGRMALCSMFAEIDLDATQEILLLGGLLGWSDCVGASQRNMSSAFIHSLCNWVKRCSHHKYKRWCIIVPTHFMLMVIVESVQLLHQLIHYITMQINFICVVIMALETAQTVKFHCMPIRTHFLSLQDLKEEKINRGKLTTCKVLVMPVVAFSSCI